MAYAVWQFMESKLLTIVVKNTGVLCLNVANELNTFTEDKIYEVDCGDPKIIIKESLGMQEQKNLIVLPPCCNY